MTLSSWSFHWKACWPSRLLTKMNFRSMSSIRTHQTVCWVFAIFLNGPTPASFLFIFGLFKQTNIFIANQFEKNSWPSSIWRRDLNPRPLEDESPPITTRPGLFNNRIIIFLLKWLKTLDNQTVHLILIWADCNTYDRPVFVLVNFVFSSVIVIHFYPIKRAREYVVAWVIKLHTRVGRLLKREWYTQ